MRVVATRPNTQFENPPEANFWVGLYVDGFQPMSSRPGSVIGIYAIFFSLHLHEARKMNNIFTVTLVPDRACLEQAIRVVVKQFKDMRNGLLLAQPGPTNTDNKVASTSVREVAAWNVVYPRLASVATDAKEGSRLCCHSGISSTYLCRCCFVNNDSKMRSVVCSFFFTLIVPLI